MFRDEADLASRLDHKNICHVHAYGDISGTWFIAMEYLHGVPLSRMMTRLSKAGKMLDIRIVAGIIVQACEGLHAAHEARDENSQLMGVVHRDVSPPNIMVTSDGTVKLLDFGIAKARGANSRTRTGTVKGKNAYMSPEQILGKPLDRRSDVFALGIVMYEMLAIKRLFHRDSDFLTFKAITEEPIPDIRERRPDLPPGMRAALLQAMARDPNGRFDSAHAFGNALKNSLATLGGPASASDLARLLSTDFFEEMSARDEIIKAADEVPLLPPKPPPIPARALRPTPPPPLPMGERSGELAHRARQKSDLFPAIPSMIVQGQEGSSQFSVPRQEGSAPFALPRQEGSAPILVPPLPAGVLDLSSTVPADTWLLDPDTDLLGAHRRKTLRNLLIATAGIAVVGGLLFVAFEFYQPAEQRAEVAPAPDAAVEDPVDAAPKPIDADRRSDIEALARYGFFSLAATAKTTVYFDGKLIGDTPLTRVPMLPGAYKVKAIGPRGKVKNLKVNIYGGKDTDEGTITW